jgi:cytochrome b involved in lipid metabolism
MSETNTAGEVKKYTVDEVAKHNKSEDLWVILKDKIYDLTRFWQSHPGGPDLI